MARFCDELQLFLVAPQRRSTSTPSRCSGTTAVRACDLAAVPDGDPGQNQRGDRRYARYVPEMLAQHAQAARSPSVRPTEVTRSCHGTTPVASRTQGVHPRLPREAAAEISRPRTRIGEKDAMPANALIRTQQFSRLLGLTGTRSPPWPPTNRTHCALSSPGPAPTSSSTASHYLRS